MIAAVDGAAVGFVGEVPEPDDLLPRAYEVARAYLARSPFALGRNAAFLERRGPRFTGR